MERTARPQIIQTLNEMLEEERAAVEAVIGLAAMATDPSERENLQRIGGNEVWSCSGLRTHIEALGGTASRHISDFATYVLSLEYFPERLRTFGRHQRLIMERISTLLTHRRLEDDTKTFLEEMLAQHAKDIVWCEQRAQVFEATRYQGESTRYQSPPPTPPRPFEGMAPMPPPPREPPPSRQGNGIPPPLRPNNGLGSPRSESMLPPRMGDALPPLRPSENGPAARNGDIGSPLRPGSGPAMPRQGNSDVPPRGREPTVPPHTNEPPPISRTSEPPPMRRTREVAPPPRANDPDQAPRTSEPPAASRASDQPPALPRASEPLSLPRASEPPPTPPSVPPSAPTPSMSAAADTPSAPPPTENVGPAPESPPAKPRRTTRKKAAPATDPSLNGDTEASS